MKNQGYSRLVSDPASSNTFVSDTLQQQDTWRISPAHCILLKTCHIKSAMNFKINQSKFFNGIQIQFLALSLLDDLESTMHRTENRMDGVMKKLAKVTNMDDDARQWKAIFFLIGLIIFLFMLLIAF
ncbi:SNARE domain protein [Aphelenchoides besseyi]|nr:SNARE domain protein [Aphelenchoides besseyi]